MSEEDIRQTGFLIYPPSPTLFIDYSKQPVSDPVPNTEPVEDFGPECPCDLCNPWAGENDDDTPTPEPATDPYEVDTP